MTGKILTATALLLVGSLLFGYPTQAIAVDIAVPGDQPTIADAFEIARSGDRVQVAPGVYFESGLVIPSGVVLAGMGSGPEDVVIDGRGQDRILLAEGVDYTTQVTNIKFINGRAVGHTSYERSGGAIFCSNSFLSINNCIFADNVSDGHGGAIRCNNATPLIIGCVFEGNEATSGGGGAIDCSFDSSPLIQGCDFAGNKAAWGGAVSCRGFSSPKLFAVTFTGNGAVGNKGYGGAVFADFGAEPISQQSTYADNTARYGGALACLSTAATNLENCTLAGNSATILGGGLFVYNATPRINSTIIVFQDGTGISAEGGAAPEITCSDIYGNSRGDWVGGIATQLGVGENLQADPLFCADGAASPYALTDDSPCGAADLACGYMGAWPIGCESVGTTVSTFAARWQDHDAELNWQARTFGGTTPQFRLVGSRSAGTEPEWEVPFEDLGGGYYAAVDADRAGSEQATYIYRLYLAEAGGDWVLLEEARLVATPDVPALPDIGELSAAPNPFNPMTTISFRLGRDQRAWVAIYSADGRRVADLANRYYGAGLQSVSWDGRDAQGNNAGSGTYIVLVQGEKERVTRKITLLK